MRVLFYLMMIVVITASAAADDRETPYEVVGAPLNLSAAEIALLDELTSAKRSGTHEEVLALEEQLAALRGAPLRFLAPDRTGQDPTFKKTCGPEGERWYPGGDFRIAGNYLDAREPSLAAASNGKLYCLTDWGDPYVNLYLSRNSGFNWFRVCNWGGDATTPAILITEGDRDFLFAAMTNGTKVHLTRFDLYNLVQAHYVPLEENLDGVSNVCIASDCNEFDEYYVYACWNSRTATGWDLRFARSIDQGDHWTEPITLASYAGGSLPYNPSGTSPAMAYGGRMLYVAFDDIEPPGPFGPRDIYVIRGYDYGATWTDVVQVTDHEDDEFAPEIAAVQGAICPDGVAVIGYTRDFLQLDLDARYASTTNSGDTWWSSRCLACTEATERHPAFTTSRELGRIHSAYYDNGWVAYRWAPYDALTSWSDEITISSGDYCSYSHPCPALLVNPTRTVDREVGVAWTDVRNPNTDDDVYFNAAWLTELSDIEEPESGESCGGVRFHAPASPLRSGDGATICFELAHPAMVSLEICDATGRAVRTLEASQQRGAGEHALRWDGCDERGYRVNAGVYFYRLMVDESAQSQRVVIVE